MLPIFCKLSVHFYRSLYSCLYRLFFCLEQTKKFSLLLPINSVIDIGPPFLVSLVKRDSNVAVFVVGSGFPIEAILLRRGFSKIFKPIVISNPIDVVYFVFGPFSRHNKPCDPMDWVISSAHTNRKIARGMSIPCIPIERACFWNVKEFLYSPLGSQIIAEFSLWWDVVVSHWTLLRSQWLGAATGVGSAPPLRLT